MNHLMGEPELPGVAAGLALDVDSIRGDFPVLQQQVHGHPLVYLDNGASAQKPEAVIQVMADYYFKDHANVHRGVHTLSQRATDRYEGVRGKSEILFMPVLPAKLFMCEARLRPSIWWPRVMAKHLLAQRMRFW